MSDFIKEIRHDLSNIAMIYQLDPTNENIEKSLISIIKRIDIFSAIDSYEKSSIPIVDMEAIKKILSPYKDSNEDTPSYIFDDKSIKLVESFLLREKVNYRKSGNIILI